MNNVGALEIKGMEGEMMSQELADIKVDSLTGDDEDDEGIPELENVVDLIFDACRNGVQVCIHVKCMCPFAVLEY